MLPELVDEGHPSTSVVFYKIDIYENIFLFFCFYNWDQA